MVSNGAGWDVFTKEPFDVKVRADTLETESKKAAKQTARRASDPTQEGGQTTTRQEDELMQRDPTGEAAQVTALAELTESKLAVSYINTPKRLAATR